MNKMNKLLMAAALAATTFSAQAEQKKGPEWLSDALFYQIYPSSFMDSDGNGIGDLPGITSKLDYIKSLGVNALWLNPIFESGWFDGGYDVIDFYKVDPRFGTNTDLVTLVNEAHKRGMKVCLDLVAGHTSSKCAWFKESAQKDANQRYSDYYIWMNDIPESEKKEIEARHQEASPESSTRGRFVEANAPRAKYYEKNFFECQPALNYGYLNPDPNHPWEQSMDAPGPQAVRRELRNIMAFWFDKGVDGFRVDMASSLVKNDPDKKGVSKIWHEMRAWKDKNYPETVLISEWSNPEQAIPAGFNIDFFIHFGIKGYPSLFFNYDTPWGKIDNTYKYCYFDKSGKGSLKEFTDNYVRAYNATKDLGYIAAPSANHDFQRPNIGSRNTVDQLKVAMTFFLTMPGVPFIYYGDEIGMKYQMDLPNKEGSNDRAGTRTPMQWTKGKNAGFSTCASDQLYLPVDTENGKLTVEAQNNDKKSLLAYTRQLTALRHSVKALNNEGAWKLLNQVGHSYPMVYERTLGAEKYIVVLNPSAKAASLDITAMGGKPVSVLSTGKVEYKAGKKNDVVKAAGISAAVFKLDK
mgnify:FL=1